MKITNMDDAGQRRALLAVVEMEMERIALANGLTFKRGNASYSDTMCRFTGMQFTVKETADGVDGAEAEFKRMTPIFKHTFGKTLYVGGKNLKIVGYSAKARKYPFIGEDVDTGKRYKITVEQMRAGFMGTPAQG